MSWLDDILEDNLGPENLEELHLPDMETILPTGYLSYSQVNLYLNCAERYRRRYLLRQKSPASSKMAQGRMLHMVLEVLLLEKRDSGKVPPRELHHDLISDVLGEYFNEVEDWEEKLPNIEEAETQSRDLIDLYYDERLPEVRVKDVERKIGYMIRDRIPFVGYIDLIERGEMDDPADPIQFDEEGRPVVKATDIIADAKFTSRKYPKSRVENSLQLTIYSKAVGVSQVGYDLIVSTKKPKIVIQRAERSPGEQEHALDVVESIADAIGRGSFPKTNPDSWMCSEKWCPYWSDCRGKRG